MKIIFLSTLFIVLLSTTGWAQSDENNPVSVHGKVCEKIINGESKSSARMRATDKASFKAVENIAELASYRNTLSSHQFNLNVYRLVDNYLEDISITVLSQTDEAVCLDVSANLPQSSIAEVFAPDSIDSVEQSNASLSLDIEENAFAEELQITIPPKPQITINDDIAYDSSLPTDDKKNVVTHSPQENISLPVSKNDNLIFFIDKTEFYNGKTTNSFFPFIEQQLSSHKQIKAVAQLNNPNYILKTKVLKAKVDNLNSETGRLQIVVAAELTDTSTSETITEHQNRFILFNSGDDAQTIATNLTKKLFAKAISELLRQTKIPHDQNTAGQIITPN